MTAEDPPQGKIESFYWSMLAESLQGILRTCGCESAAGLLQRRYADLVESYKKDEGRYQDLPDCALNSVRFQVHFPSVCYRC